MLHLAFEIRDRKVVEKQEAFDQYTSREWRNDNFLASCSIGDMNLGGIPSINLSEAARLLKHSNVGINSIQNQQVPPPMMFMQQAVAMQQFQFQQALLMQQVMATQQAAARAATVKSAQEMAATRAAEISKLLEGIESNVEEKKKSLQRFISRTPSRSRSRSHSRLRSFSRSKSKSPLRYRRDRSTSRSPIRYRQDSRPSPISREHFGYRGRSRRGYYRGRGEYGWNPLYRRDWERKRDHYSLYSYRSRSRSRSQVSRRSCTPSGSPRSRQKRSSTPLKFRQNEQRLERSSRHLRSLETKPFPSCGQSQSYSRSRSRSCSESLHHEHGSQSPIQIPIDKKIGGDHNQAKKLSLVVDSDKCILMKNANTNGNKEKIYSTTIINENEGIVEHWNFRSKSKTEQSISPTRSLSISLSPPKKKRRGKLESEPRPNDWKKAMVRGVLFQRIDEVAAMDEPPQINVTPFVNVEDGEGNPNALVEHQIDVEGDVKSKEEEFEVNEQYPKIKFDKTKSPFDENEGVKEGDLWQDDIKANELEKIEQKEYKQKMDKKEEEKKNLDIPIVMHGDVKDHVMTLLEHLDIEIRELKVDFSIAYEDQGNAIANTMSKRGTPNNDVIFAKPIYSNETLISGLCIKEEILNIVSKGIREGGMGIGEEIGDASIEKNSKCDDAIDREGDLGLIFEGPMLPPDLDIEISEDLEEKIYVAKKCENITKKTRPKELSSIVVEEEVVIFRKKDKSRNKEVEDVHGVQRSKDKLMLKDDNELYKKCKLKEKSELRERSRNKRYNDKIEYEKRKEKHRKYKKKHRKIEEIEREENDNDENKDVDIRKNKEEHHRHCNKKHGRGWNHKEDKDAKRRHRHKHRGKLTLEPLDKESLVVD